MFEQCWRRTLIGKFISLSRFTAGGKNTRLKWKPAYSQFQWERLETADGWEKKSPNYDFEIHVVWVSSTEIPVFIQDWFYYVHGSKWQPNYEYRPVHASLGTAAFSRVLSTNYGAKCTVTFMRKHNSCMFMDRCPAFNFKAIGERFRIVFC